jgi:hypothetical protein
MSVIKMTDLDLAGKRVFIRADLNVPVKDGKVTSDARIRASLPTIELALKQGAKVMVTSHLGRPTEGEYNEEFSLLPVVNYLKDKLSTRYVWLKITWMALKWLPVNWSFWKTFASTKARRKTTKRCPKIRCAVRRVRDGRFRYCTPRRLLPTVSVNSPMLRAQARCWPLNWTRWVKR